MLRKTGQGKEVGEAKGCGNVRGPIISLEANNLQIMMACALAPGLEVYVCMKAETLQLRNG